MPTLTPDLIRTQVADSPAIFERGMALYENGAFVPKAVDPQQRRFTYLVDGSYGDCTIDIQLAQGGIQTSCDCPYPGAGRGGAQFRPGVYRRAAGNGHRQQARRAKADGANRPADR